MVLLALDSCIKTAITVLSTKTFADYVLFVGLSVRKKKTTFIGPYQFLLSWSAEFRPDCYEVLYPSFGT